jgi:hypothetical protein
LGTGPSNDSVEHCAVAFMAIVGRQDQGHTYAKECTY